MTSAPQTENPPFNESTPGVRASCIPVTRGDDPNSLEDQAVQPETTETPTAEVGDHNPAEGQPVEPEVTAVPLCPNRSDINRHLSALFAPEFVHAYPDARIEIAYANMAGSEKPDAAETFSAFDLKGATDFAERMSRGGYNVYVGPTLRKAGTTGRASETDVEAGLYAWSDLDEPGDLGRVNDVLKKKALPTSMLVMTGRTPHERGHPYFKFSGGTTPDNVRAANIALKTLLGSDHVDNPAHLMRLAGSINYPSRDKRGRGYVPELVTLHVRKSEPSYAVERLTGLAGTASGNASDMFGFNTRLSRNDDELMTLLEASRVEGKWHNSMRDAIATMIGRGWSDTAIRLGCAPYCKGGANDHDLDDMIDRARAKWDKPDKEQIASGVANSDDDSNANEGDERVANEAPIAQRLAVIKIHKRISLLTSEAQRMLIDANVPFYHRGGELVRPIIRTVKASRGNLTRTAQLKTISSVYMRDTMCRHARWVRFDARKMEWVQAIAPMNVAETLLARDGVWSFAEIVGVIACPTLRPDGSLLVKQGYDSVTRLILIEPPAMPPIPDQPTRDEALQALALLEDLVCESPFEDGASKSVALSGMITPVVRGAMPVAPMHTASAPTAGTGKSFLWDLVAAISMGQRRIPVISAGNEEETEKRLTGRADRSAVDQHRQRQW